jgi:processing peptidase subunit beta
VLDTMCIYSHFWLCIACLFISSGAARKSCTVMAAGIAEDIGRQLLTYHRRLSKPELFARIGAVTPATIKRVAERFIYDQDLAIAAIGDVQNLPDYTWFRRRTYWLRY